VRWRILLAALFLTLAACAFYGFMAADDPAAEAFQGPYLVFSLSAVGVASWLLFRRPRKQ
jgi:hypothetical protein